MNLRVLLVAPISVLAAPLLSAQSGQRPEAPVPVSQAPARSDGQSLMTPPAGENQRLYGPAQSSLISPEAAKALIDRFRAAYAKDGAPRIVVYVNRELVDTASGLQLTGHTEHYENTTNSEGGAEKSATAKTSGKNTYSVKDTSKPTLADQQTVRDVERLIGRVFRNAGAKLADQKTAASLLPDQPGRLTGDQAARDRAALSQIGDFAIEVLISSRNLTVPAVAEDQTYSVPDLQMTAIRLKDSAVVGQASANDVLGRGVQTSQIVRRFGVNDITEATAFALIEDMLTGEK